MQKQAMDHPGRPDVSCGSKRTYLGLLLGIVLLVPGTRLKSNPRLMAHTH